MLHNKEHLAALNPAGPALMLGTLRWANEVRSPDALDLPKEGATANSLKPAELKMAQQLIDEMTSAWKPTEFKDDFTSAIRALIQKKAKAGKTSTVEPFEEAPDLGSSNVVDLSELLRQSLGSKSKGSKATPADTSKKEAEKKTPVPKKAAPAKSQAKKAA